MNEPETLRVFVNGAALSVPRSATILDAVRAFDAAAADAVAAGERAVTDSRGLPIALDAPATGGAVLRLVSARALRENRDSGDAK
jgi:hypothetical protein